MMAENQPRAVRQGAGDIPIFRDFDESAQHPPAFPGRNHPDDFVTTPQQGVEAKALTVVPAFGACPHFFQQGFQRPVLIFLSQLL